MRIDSGIDVKLHKVCSCLFIGLFSYVFIKSQKLQCFLGVMMDYVLYCIFCIILYYIALYCIILYYYVGFYGLLMTSYAIPLQDAARLESVICANRSEQRNAASLDAEPGDLAVIPCEDTTAKLSICQIPVVAQRSKMTYVHSGCGLILSGLGCTGSFLILSMSMNASSVAGR